MGLKGHDTRDIFPDFRSYIYPPVSPAWFNPKAWGIADAWGPVGWTLLHVGAQFVTKNVQVGDAIYILSDEITATTIFAVSDEDTIHPNHVPAAAYTDVLYKVGHGAHHTIASLSQILSIRNLVYYTIHHGKLWTGAQIRDWNPDETGEVYVIGHDTQKARWLDGEITLPVGFPDDKERPPEPMNIAGWEERFPGQPRPDYPSGLEPGGNLRTALIVAHGSLQEAEEDFALTT